MESSTVTLSSSDTPIVSDDILWFPVHHMRGGTSTGVVLEQRHVPVSQALRDELIRRIMGLAQEGTLSGNRQLSGLGRGVATSNKVFIVGPAERMDADIQSTLAQLAADRSVIDWSVNCGNMSAALPLFALDRQWCQPASPQTAVRIWNTNTNVLTDAYVPYPFKRVSIDGVLGEFPEVWLSLRDPVGSKTGALFPTGSRAEVIDHVQVTCIDVAVPMLIIRAADLGLQGTEPPAYLAQNSQLKARLRDLWIEAGLRMGLRRTDGQRMTADDLRVSETIPKVCLIAPGRDGHHLCARYFTPQQPHDSMAVTGACSLATATLIPDFCQLPQELLRP
jgi:4-oxalomesaconate tautomerase